MFTCSKDAVLKPDYFPGCISDVLLPSSHTPVSPQHSSLPSFGSETSRHSVSGLKKDPENIDLIGHLKLLTYS